MKPMGVNKKDADKAWIGNLIFTAQERKFYGKLVLIFEDGVLRRVVKKESLLPPNSQ